MESFRFGKAVASASKDGISVVVDTIESTYQVRSFGLKTMGMIALETGKQTAEKCTENSSKDSQDSSENLYV